jgi:hypothetical protein
MATAYDGTTTASGSGRGGGRGSGSANADQANGDNSYASSSGMGNGEGSSLVIVDYYSYGPLLVMASQTICRRRCGNELLTLLEVLGSIQHLPRAHTHMEWELTSLPRPQL